MVKSSRCRISDPSSNLVWSSTYIYLWYKKKDASLVIKEAAILFESDSHLGLDAVICISCPEAIRIERVQKRDQISKDEVLNRINKQMPQNEKEKSQTQLNNQKQNSQQPNQPQQQPANTLATRTQQALDKKKRLAGKGTLAPVGTFGTV